MEKAERQRLTLERIDPVLKAKGYKTRKADGMWYYLPQDGITVTWSLGFQKKYSFINFRAARITHDEVELLLQRVADEDYPFPWDIHRGTILTTTVRHHSFIPKYHLVAIDTEEEVAEFCDWYLGYINGEGADFVQYYSYLPNVLKRMDELVEAGLTWQYPDKGILSGTLDARFRGLIISKLCNDPNFERKIAWCDEGFYDGTNDKWLPYYEKLKAEVLPTIEPKYNIYT